MSAGREQRGIGRDYCNEAGIRAEKIQGREPTRVLGAGVCKKGKDAKQVRQTDRTRKNKQTIWGQINNRQRDELNIQNNAYGLTSDNKHEGKIKGR